MSEYYLVRWKDEIKKLLQIGPAEEKLENNYVYAPQGFFE